MSTEGRALFTAAAGELDLDVAPVLDAFSTFQALLLQTNRHTNLTALTSERDIVLKHFVDSLTCLRSNALDGSLRVLDLGSGAGFPGLPLAILRPELQLTLLDSTRKKIEFTRLVVDALGLGNVGGIVGRAEWLGRQPLGRGGYDRVVTRAVSRLPVLAELALPLLRVGGLLIAQKGVIGEDELQAGRQAAAAVGGVLEDVQRFELPVLHEGRSLIALRKTRPTPQRFPRLEGVPAKHPLF